MEQIEKFVRDRDIKMPSWNNYGLSLNVWNPAKDKEHPKSPKSPTPPHEKSKYKFLASPIAERKLRSKSPDPKPAIQHIVNGITSNIQNLKNFSSLDSTGSPKPSAKKSRR